MLSAISSPLHGVSRRELLRLAAFTPVTIASAHETPIEAGFGKAKRCILLFLWGSPSQLETWDPKPDAPPEIRGEFGSVPTSISGIRIGGLFPRIAKLANKVTFVRSLTHNHPIHGTAFALTARPTTDLDAEGDTARDPRHWPYIGSVVDHYEEQRDARPPAIPRNFGLPFPLGSHRRLKPGPYGGFLGGAYDTVWSDFRAKGTREVLRDAGAPDVPTKMVADPFLGILPTDRFDAAADDPTIVLDRLNRRASLLEQLDSTERRRSKQPGEEAFNKQHLLARTVLASGRLRNALDIQREPARLRERYGMTLFGQSCLAARRLLEAGGKFVTVCWDEYGLVNTGWDTHVHMKSRMTEELGPGFDAAFATLIEDLEARGMLEDTAIAVVSEHGRTPRIQNVDGGGRDHWARAYSSLFAGGGFARGRVVGRTDRLGGEVVEAPFSPKDVIATLFHLLGINPESEIHDRFARPWRIGGPGIVRTELIG
ncbi:MAG: DUF1501 domain-containing protein [Gemmataceae bacterium]